MFKIHCPHCQHKLSADATQSGATLQCPACGVDFVIPSPTDEVVIQPQSPEDSAEATASREIQPEQSSQPETSPEPGASHSFAERLRDGYKATQEGAKFIKKGALVGWAGLKRRSKQAALKVQIVKLRNIDLRKPYHALGKSAFEQGILADELTERFQAIQDLDAKIAGHREKTSADAGETKMAALIRVSKDTAKSGQAQALTVKREHLITVLGREIHACKEQMSTGDLSDEFSAIDDIENRIRDKEDEVRGLNDGGKSGIQTLAVAAVIGLLVIGAFYGMKMLGGGEVREKFTDSAWVKATFSEAVALDRLKQRNVDGKPRYFLPNAEKPVTGWVKEIDESSKNRTLIHLKSGIRDGSWASFYKNGQLEFRGTYKEGDKRGIQESWYENGQKSSEYLWDGKVVSVKVWKPNGEVCPETRVEGGNGKEIGYGADGKPYTMSTWKDGEGSFRYVQKKDEEEFAAVYALSRAINESAGIRSHGSSRQDNSVPKTQNQDNSGSPDFEMGFRAGAIGSNLPFTNREAYLEGRQFGEKAKSMPVYTQGYNQGREHGIQEITRRSNPFNKISQKVEWLAWDYGYSIGNGEGRVSRALSR